MKAEYNKWYKCEEGQMPEDFENVLDNPVITWEDTSTFISPMGFDRRVCDDIDGWRWETNQNPEAWLIIKPYI